MDRESLQTYVEEALTHLNDHSWLANCPLAQVLVSADRGDAGAQLSLIMSAAMRELRPVHAQQESAPEWRQYRYLLLRYALGAPPKQIAQELSVSDRQARRDHQDAMRALSDLLSRRYSQLHEQDWGQRDHSPEDASAPDGHRCAQCNDVVQAEVARLGSAPSTGMTVVEEAVRGVLNTVGNLAAQHGLQIHASFGATPCFVATDHAVLRQIVLNLLLFLVERHPDATAERRTDARVTLTVTDRGRWMEMRLEVRPSAEGEPNPTGEPNLTGELNPTGEEMRLDEANQGDRRLIVSGRLLATQGGTLHVYGSRRIPDTILVSLPAVWIAKVLVIDDNPDFVRLFQRYLGERAYRVYHANNAQEALQMAGEVRPDVITLDVMMPSQDGWEILSALKAQPDANGTPIIVCSVLDERALAASLGATEFLLKPVTQSDLLAALDRCCGHSPEAARRE